MLIWFASALAAGFYHPNDVAAASETFGSAQSELLGPLETRQKTARALSNALRSYREGLDALGAAPADQVSRLEALEADYHRQFDGLQTFADQLVGDFDAAFTDALGRALAAHPGAMECVAEVAVGPRVPGMGGRTQKNPNCKGSDLNATIAAAIDADPTLKAALPGIVGRPWPELGMAPEPQAVVGSGERYVHVQHLLEKGAGRSLRAIDRDDDDARMAIGAELEDGADAAELKRLAATGEQIAAATAIKRAQLAAPILAAATKALDKAAKKSEPTAWCVQPQALGGCVGTDVTSETVQMLLSDKGVAKALP